jgi:hypothetical protein
VTETQAAQIELDKTAEEFKRLNEERHKIYLQLQDTLDNSNQREVLIQRTAQKFSEDKENLDK